MFATNTIEQSNINCSNKLPSCKQKRTIQKSKEQKNILNDVDKISKLNVLKT